MCTLIPATSSYSALTTKRAALSLAAHIPAYYLRGLPNPESRCSQHNVVKLASPPPILNWCIQNMRLCTTNKVRQWQSPSPPTQTHDVMHLYPLLREWNTVVHRHRMNTDYRQFIGVTIVARMIQSAWSLPSCYFCWPDLPFPSAGSIRRVAVNNCRDSQILVYFSRSLGSFMVCSGPLECSSCGLNRLSLGWFVFSVQRVLIEWAGFLGSSIFPNDATQ